MTWELMGKLGVIISALWAALQIYKHFSQKNHSVSYTVSRLERVLPPLEKKVDEWIDRSWPNYVKLRMTPADAVEKSVEELKGKIGQLVRDIPDSFIRIDLMNSGKKTAKRIAVDLNKSPDLYRFSSEEMKLEGSVIRLDELRPGQSVTANLWYGYYLSYEKIIVSHEDYSVAKPLTVTGYGLKMVVLDALLSRHGILLWISIIMLFFLGASQIYTIGYKAGVAGTASVIVDDKKGGNNK